jgi:hypothetical protein
MVNWGFQQRSQLLVIPLFQCSCQKTKSSTKLPKWSSNDSKDTITLCTLRKKAFITEVLFIDCLQNMFIPKVAHHSQSDQMGGLNCIDYWCSRHSLNSSSYCARWLSRIVVDSTCDTLLAQSIDLCNGLLEITFSNERKSKGIKEVINKYILLCLHSTNPVWFT